MQQQLGWCASVNVGDGSERMSVVHGGGDGGGVSSVLLTRRVVGRNQVRRMPSRLVL